MGPEYGMSPTGLTESSLRSRCRLWQRERTGDHRVLLSAEDCCRGDGRRGQPLLNHPRPLVWFGFATDSRTFYTVFAQILKTIMQKSGKSEGHERVHYVTKSPGVVFEAKNKVSFPSAPC